MAEFTIEDINREAISELLEDEQPPVVIEEPDNTLKRRALNAKDIYPVATIISKLGVKEFADVFKGLDIQAFTEEGVAGDELAAVVGIEAIMGIVSVILENLGKCQSDIDKLLASVYEVDVPTLQESPPAVYAEMIIETIKSEEFGDFFKVVLKLLGMA